MYDIVVELQKDGEKVQRLVFSANGPQDQTWHVTTHHSDIIEPTHRCRVYVNTTEA